MSDSYIRMLGSVLICRDCGYKWIVRYVHFEYDNFQYGYASGDSDSMMPTPFWLPGGSLHLGVTWKEAADKAGFSGFANPFADDVFDSRVSDKERL